MREKFNVEMTIFPSKGETVRLEYYQEKPYKMEKLEKRSTQK